MIGWIKYSPISLREADNNLTDLRGPSFNSASEKQLNIGGSSLAFRLPARSFFGTTADMYDTGKNDALKMDAFRPQSPSAVLSNTWEEKIIMVRQWSCNGPWFAGSKGRIHFVVILKKRKPGKAFSTSNFLHSKSFEFALCDDLDNTYGGSEFRGKARYQAPVSWRPVDKLPVPSVRYNISSAPGTDKRFSLPVTEDILCHIALSYYGADIIQKHMDELADKIFDSVRFEPSPVLQTKLDAIKNSPEGQQTLSPTMAPLKWPITKEEYENPNLASTPEPRSLEN